MGSIKKLAGQTMWYGVSSMAARFLFYLLTPYLTLKLSGVGYGDMSIMYAAIPFMNVLFTYGIETAYFRFATNPAFKKDIYSTATISIISTTVLFMTLLMASRSSIATLLRLEKYPELVTYSALIIAFDTLATLPFAKLRLEQRPRKYAIIRVLTICFQIGVIYFFLSVCPRIAADHPDGLIATFYKPNYGVGYVILANVFASVFALVLLQKEFLSFQFKFNKTVWLSMMGYSLPLLIAGLGGMINETFDRLMLSWLSPGSEADAKVQVAIYSGVYKLSILITLFIQAFRMGAEPFFFKQSEGRSPQRTYARVMKFFVIAISLMFLGVALYLDIWKHFLSKPENSAINIYWTGLKVVPILLLANMFLGIYYNLSIWYKLTNQTLYGAYITVIGAVITLAVNFLLIPYFGFVGSAWATFLCYGSMMVTSYLWGQKYYPVPYATKKLVAYIVIVVLLYFIHKLIISFNDGFVFSIATATVLVVLYVWFLSRTEKKEINRLMSGFKRRESVGSNREEK